MSSTRDYLALDLGATSGRAVIGAFDGSRMELREVYRFPNGPVERSGRLHWDWPALWGHIERGLGAAAAASSAISAVGCDSWGLDHGFLDPSGELLEWPYSYQDPRTEGILDEIVRVMPPEELFDRTAVPVIGLSTLGQLLVTRRQRPELLERARTLAFIPGLVHHRLTGVAATEYCGAGSSGLCDWRTRTWDEDLLARFNLPAHLFPEMKPSGTVLGTVRPEVAQRLGIPAWEVFQPSGHDTALAVAAAPIGPSDLVISSGTWSMLGVPVCEPRVGRDAFRTGGGNYGVPGDEWVFLRGIMGLWLLERLRREEGLPDPAAVEALAASAPPFACLFAPDDDRLLRGPSLRSALAEASDGRAQSLEAATLARAILESLALFVDRTRRQLEAVTDRTVERIVIVGGGSRNNLLNQFTANATGLPVVTGSPEATALGNALVQAAGRGDLSDWSQVREAAAQSSPSRCFEPTDADAWAEARAAFTRISEETECLKKS